MNPATKVGRWVLRFAERFLAKDDWRGRILPTIPYEELNRRYPHAAALGGNFADWSFFYPTPWDVVHGEFASPSPFDLEIAEDVERVLRDLNHDPALRYALEEHLDVCFNDLAEFQSLFQAIARKLRANHAR